MTPHADAARARALVVVRRRRPSAARCASSACRGPSISRAWRCALARYARTWQVQPRQRLDKTKRAWRERLTNALPPKRRTRLGAWLAHAARRVT